MGGICIKKPKPPTLPFLVFALFHYFCKKVTFEDEKGRRRAGFGTFDPGHPSNLVSDTSDGSG
jgi:hypothetical protein